MRNILHKNKALVQFVLLSLVITAITAFIAGAEIDRRGREYLIQSHIKLYPVLVENILKHYPSLLSSIAAASPTVSPLDASRLFGDFKAIGTVFRIKIWSREGMVVWSDDRGIIGKSFGENGLFRAAREGATTFSVLGPSEIEKYENEHEGEAAAGSFLEIYVPMRAGGRIVGVLELYEHDERFFAAIKAQTRSIWGIIGASGGIIFLSLFLVYARADTSLSRAISKIEQTQQVTIFALAYQAELRDAETGRHIERTSRYVRILAEGVRRSKRYPGYMGGPYIDDIVRSAPLHDIGKVALPDTILRKPGRLTQKEFAEIKKHCEFGVRILDEAHAELPFQSFLVLARQLILHHHERWDGTGYPAALAAERIPLSGRIMAIADVYDAMRSRRPYKDPLPHDACVKYIAENSGKSFDPGIVKIFIETEQEFRKISEELDDR